MPGGSGGMTGGAGNPGGSGGNGIAGDMVGVRPGAGLGA